MRLGRLDGRGSTTAAPADAPLPGQAGIRPGSMMISPFIWTMNYIFRKGGTLAIGTAGHCLKGGEPVVLLTAAPTGGDPVLVQLGKTLLRRNGGIGRDYGLSRSRPRGTTGSSERSPASAVPAGPTREATPSRRRTLRL